MPERDEKEWIRMDATNVDIRRIEAEMVYGDGPSARTWREAIAITDAFRTEVLFGLLMNGDAARVRRYIDRVRKTVSAAREVA